MEFKVKILEKGPMILTGSKVLKSIGDYFTPPIDLLVRESIQNCADQILDDKDFGRINFHIGDFNSSCLTSTIMPLRCEMEAKYKDVYYDYIAIEDSNTKGLLGAHIKNEDGGPNNLFNLVYDFMGNNDNSNSGGSWGIGKSVYYRYGNGIVFYYSRTFEDGKFISKLAGALIQNENEENCLLGSKTSGIAYFGSLDSNGNGMPIYDEKTIAEFLKIFNLEPYEDEKTGTVVIIPYIDKNELVTKNKNDDKDIHRYWLENLESVLSMSIQRWYFARINNESYNGKYLKIAINSKKIELCLFYQKLQELYNGTLQGCVSKTITNKRIGEDKVLGCLNYKIFTYAELGVNVAPTNYPSPKYFVDSESLDDQKDGILFYLRKPGMVLNYDNKEFGSYQCDENSCLIGMFILNDDLEIAPNETLGKYMRGTEKSNHFEWRNENLKKFPVLSKKKPFSQITSSIKGILNEQFKKTNVVYVDGSSNIYQKKYGEKLMPPSDFGDKPSVPQKDVKHKGKGGTGPVVIPPVKPKKTELCFLGPDQFGFLQYELVFVLPEHYSAKFNVNIKAGSNTFSFGEWETMDFKFPCKITNLEVLHFFIDGEKKEIPQTIPLDESFSRKRKQLVDNTTVYRFLGFMTKNGIPYGFEITNACDCKLSLRLLLKIEPIDNKYSIGFDSEIGKENNDEH